MTDESRLRDLLHRAVTTQPPGGDRVAGALALGARRRQQRTVALSCVAALGLAIATVTARGGAGSTGLRPHPVTPVDSPTGEPTPAGSDSPSPIATESPEEEQQPDQYASPKPTPSNAQPPPAAPSGAATRAVPPRTEQLDIYVLLDATSSMQAVGPYLDSALRGLGTALRRQGVETFWGLATYRDTTTTTTVGDTAPYTYRQVGAIGDRYVSTVGTRYAYGGDVPEAATMALMASGGVGIFPYTEGGAGAGFRPGARKLVLLVTDAPTHEDDPHPTIAQVVADMRASDVGIVALQVITGHDVRATRAHLDALAAGTGTFAVAAVDCDGDGQKDLDRNNPLVCEVPGGKEFAVPGLATALLAILGGSTGG